MLRTNVLNRIEVLLIKTRALRVLWAPIYREDSERITGESVGHY